MIGASGAISGLLGAYVVLYPRARVVVLFWFLFLLRMVRVPASIVLGFWFVMQLTGILGDSGGVAWFAHIGGFLFGGLVMLMLGGARRPRPYFV
jgi:membrane associated rhomboid family serine protease